VRVKWASRCRDILSNEPFLHAPLVFTQEHAAKLGEAIRRVVERSDDCLPIRDGEREHTFVSMSTARVSLSATSQSLPFGATRRA
jgi:hypothetical protein